MDNGFFGRYKSGSYLDCLCPQHKGCRNASSISNTSGCNHRNLYCICHLRHQRHGGGSPDMAAGLGPFRNHCVCTATLHHPGQRHAGDHRNDFTFAFFPHFHIFSRISGASGNHRNFFFHKYLRHLICIWA